MCKNCEHVCLPEFSGVKRMQCAIIGVKDKEAADIKPTWTCRKGYKLRQEKLKVIEDFLKNKE